VPRIERTAEAVWEGNVARGSGTIAGRSSGAFELPYSLATRIGSPEGKTSPEELVAAAHAGCFAMSLASELTQGGNPAERLAVAATCVMDEVEGRGHLIVASRLEVTARVPDLEATAFDELVAKADAGCPLSTLIRATAEVEVSARLEG
jgi:osmotically inducible protein OsmC